jgi:uncharacterized protein (TIGR04222 family)
MTPSLEVDEVWHLHLTYSRDYWQRFCPETLGTPLHHDPTRGGAAEGWRYREQYARTLRAYELWFGLPPLETWPCGDARFADPGRIRRVDLSRVWLIPRPRLPGLSSGSALLARVAAALGLGLWSGRAGALPVDPLDWTAEPFLSLYLVLALVALAVAFVLARRIREIGPGRTKGLDAFRLAYLAGGADRALDAGVTELLASGQAELQGSRSLALKVPVSDLTPALRSLGSAIDGGAKPRSLRASATAWLAPIEEDLLARGLLLPTEATRRWRRARALPLLALVAFGLAKVWVGVSRDRPVGFLVALCIILGIWGLYRLLAGRPRSRAADRALTDARRRHQRTLRAPPLDELALAVALAGTAALSGTAYAAYRGVNPPASGGSGCSGGSDGGDGGGGGCGGCGGGD